LSLFIMSASAQSLQQLEAARTLALGDGRYYPTIIPGVLPIIGVNGQPPLEVQRWGAEFLAETFASPTWPLDMKENSSLTVLSTLKEYMDADDAGVVKSAVQAAASIYPLVYRHMYVLNPSSCFK
jgi:symplekin